MSSVMAGSIKTGRRYIDMQKRLFKEELFKQKPPVALKKQILKDVNPIANVNVLELSF